MNCARVKIDTKKQQKMIKAILKIKRIALEQPMGKIYLQLFFDCL